MLPLDVPLHRRRRQGDGDERGRLLRGQVPRPSAEAPHPVALRVRGPRQRPAQEPHPPRALLYHHRPARARHTGDPGGDDHGDGRRAREPFQIHRGGPPRHAPGRRGQRDTHGIRDRLRQAADRSRGHHPSLTRPPIQSVGTEERAAPRCAGYVRQG